VFARFDHIKLVCMVIVWAQAKGDLCYNIQPKIEHVVYEVEANSLQI